MNPSNLQWLPMFQESINTIFQSGVQVSSSPTVNPMVFTITIKVGRRIAPKSRLQVFNLFQKWAAVNECVLQGSVEGKRVDEIIISIIVKRLHGLPQINHPLEVEDDAERQANRRRR